MKKSGFGLRASGFSTRLHDAFVGARRLKPEACLLFAWLALAASPLRAEVVNRIVASVDGEPITLYELNQFVAKQRALMPSLQMPNQNEALQALVTEKLLAREIAAKGIHVRDEDIDRYVDHIKQANRLNDDQLKEALKQQGIDYTKYRDQVRQEIEKVQLMNREIRGKVNVSPEDVNRYYEAHKAEYQLPARVKVRQIMLRLDANAPDEIVQGVTQRLEDLRAQILKGEDFAKVAKQSSEDPAAADGGDLGEVEPSKVLPEFEAALAQMKEGEVSEPIRTKMGLHLLKLEKRIDAGYQPESELAADIKEKLYNEALDERYKRWLLEDIQKHHYIETKL
jgi:peptidyl-prolyl cis-trans isomerase SurA